MCLRLRLHGAGRGMASGPSWKFFGGWKTFLRESTCCGILKCLDADEHRGPLHGKDA